MAWFQVSTAAQSRGSKTLLWGPTHFLSFFLSPVSPQINLFKNKYIYIYKMNFIGLINAWSYFFMTRKSVRLLPRPAGLSLAGSTSGYSSWAPGSRGTSAVNAR